MEIFLWIVGIIVAWAIFDAVVLEPPKKRAREEARKKQEEATARQKLVYEYDELRNVSLEGESQNENEWSHI
jgi:hypothetical protein